MMTSDPYYQMWSVLQRTSQEMMWDAVSTSVERQLEELARKAGGLKSKLGSLTTTQGPELFGILLHSLSLII